MKLSEAIFLGSKLGPQCFGVLRIDDATCAVGAAGVAMGNRSKDAWTILASWPWTTVTTEIKCPECEDICFLVGGLITHLNDTHSWTREQIADWVATVEPSEPETQGEQTDVEAFERAQ